LERFNRKNEVLTNPPMPEPHSFKRLFQDTNQTFSYIFSQTFKLFYLKISKLFLDITIWFDVGMDRTRQEIGRNWTRIVTHISLLPIIMLIFACASPPRYVVISEEMNDTTLANSNQRYISLVKKDAIENGALISLRTKSAIREYEEKRKSGSNPVENVLSSLISEDYKEAEAQLEKHWDEIPEYLRLVLKADLAYEHVGNGIEETRLVKMYQEAFEVQTSDISRNIIKLRIRQLRYGR
jgi:hypothetical protein